MENGGFDSSDSEGEASVNSDDEDAELSFESDDDGNFQQNLVKVQNGRKKLAERIQEAEEEEDDEDDEEDGEEEAEFDEDDDDESDNDAEDESDDIDDETEEEESEKEEETKAVAPPLPEASTVVEEKVAPKVEKPKFNVRTKKSPSALQALKTELADGSKPAEEDDEYNNDTSDEEDIRNTVGNIPMHWYDEYKHIGYDWDAKKIIKGPKGDQLDDFLKRMEDPNFWRTVKDAQTGQDIIISEADIELIKRINSQKIPDAAYNDYAVGFAVLRCIYRY